MKYRKPTKKELEFVDEENGIRNLENDFSYSEDSVHDLLETFDGELDHHGLELEVLNGVGTDDVIVFRVIPKSKSRRK